VRRRLVDAVVPYLNAARQVVASSCQLIAVFIAVLVLVDLLSAVVWIYLRRSVSLMPFYTLKPITIDISSN